MEPTFGFEPESEVKIAVHLFDVLVVHNPPNLRPSSGFLTAPPAASFFLTRERHGH
jgi:hypothetical protein